MELKLGNEKYELGVFNTGELDSNGRPVIKFTADEKTESLLLNKMQSFGAGVCRNDERPCMISTMCNGSNLILCSECNHIVSWNGTVDIISCPKCLVKFKKRGD